ncbi:MAG TPA: enoyl-CoA hydratase-related protein [Ktedonobacteraceae bacterium]
MSYQYVIYEKKDHLAYVTINRPEVMNALHYAANVELHEIFNAFKQDDEAWVAIVTGAGQRAFSAGNDLKATAEATAKGENFIGQKPVPFGGITSGFDCPKPLIAAVNGVAMGGGFEIALACDLIIAAEHARFALPEPRVGLMAAAGGAHRLPQQIPLKQAMSMLLTGRHVGAQEAYSMGFVNEVVPGEELLTAAERWAKQIMDCSPLSIRLTKEAALSGLSYSIEEAMQRDRPLLQRLFSSEDFIEGPKAFAEKRRPNWTGR